MKAVYRILAVLVLGVTLTHCAEENDNGSLDVVYEDELAGLDDFEAFSLAPFGINALVYLPDETADIGAAAAPRVEHEPDGFKWDLFVGQNFHMRIDDWGDDEMIAFHKEELVDFSNMYEIEFIEESDTFLYYKRTLKVDGQKGVGKNVGVEHVSYHCYGQHTIDGINYVFRTNDEGHQKPITEYMAKSIKSVKEIVQ
jgi:hypothetical protein